MIISLPTELRLSPYRKKRNQPKKTAMECHNPCRNHRKNSPKAILLFLALIL